MSFSEQLGAAVAAVKTYAQIDNLSRELWAAYAAGLIDDDSAQAATELLHARRRSLRDDPRPQVRKAFCAPPRRRVPRSPDRAKSIARRRACATSGAVPSNIACHFTLAEIAVLAVIAGQVRRTGDCRLCNDAIAGMAGTSRSVVNRALREAKELGLIHVQERPRRGAKNLSNVVTVISRDWRTWLKLRDRAPEWTDEPKQHFKKKIDQRVTLAGKSAQSREGHSRSCSREVTPLRPNSRVERNGRLEAALARRENGGGEIYERGSHQ